VQWPRLRQHKQSARLPRPTSAALARSRSPRKEKTWISTSSMRSGCRAAILSSQRPFASVVGLDACWVTETDPQQPCPECGKPRWRWPSCAAPRHSMLLPGWQCRRCLRRIQSARGAGRTSACTQSTKSIAASSSSSTPEQRSVLSRSRFQAHFLTHDYQYVFHGDAPRLESALYMSNHQCTSKLPATQTHKHHSTPHDHATWRPFPSHKLSEAAYSILYCTTWGIAERLPRQSIG
jgi:hypothetical protein